MADTIQTKSTLLLTIKEAAQELRMSEGWVKARIRDGSLRSGKFGRSVRISMEDLKAFADRKIQSVAIEKRYERWA